MKLKGFQILNYKSIKDSGYCDLSSDITILAGKNESGKSAILEALSCFDIDVKIPNNARPIENSGTGTDWRKKTVIACWFEIDDSTINEISKKIELNQNLIDYIKETLLIIEKYGDNSYKLDQKTRDIIDKISKANKEISSEIEEYINKVNEFLNTDNNYNASDSSVAVLLKGVALATRQLQYPEIISDISKPIPARSVYNNLQKSIDSFIKISKTYCAHIKKSKKNEIDGYLEEIKNKTRSLQIEISEDKLLDAIKKLIPSFILIDNFNETLPYEVSLEEDGENEKIVQCLANNAKFNRANLKGLADTQQKRNILSNSSKEISDKFNRFYTQDNLDVSIELNGDKLCFGLKENGNVNIFKLEQRSKGFQWFLSFFLKLNNDYWADNVIFLIDEPDLHLHASAQEDVLKILESLSDQGNQIVISTHSPFLMDPNKLERLRLVEKEKDKGTMISNKFWAKGALETLTPIHKAIGLDLTKAFSVVGKKNVLFEGITDYLYFQGLRCLMQDSVELNNICFIPCAGADTLQNIVPLLVGWDLEFAVVYDNDKKGKAAAENLRKKYFFYDLNIINIPYRNGAAIEDLFAPDEFISFIPDRCINNLKAIDQNVYNSKFIRDNKLDKIILARNFLNKARENNIELSMETIENFKNILKDIATLLKNFDYCETSKRKDKTK